MACIAQLDNVYRMIITPEECYHYIFPSLHVHIIVLHSWCEFRQLCHMQIFYFLLMLQVVEIEARQEDGQTMRHLSEDYCQFSGCVQIVEKLCWIPLYALNRSCSSKGWLLVY